MSEIRRKKRAKERIEFNIKRFIVNLTNHCCERYFNKYQDFEIIVKHFDYECKKHGIKAILDQKPKEYLSKIIESHELNKLKESYGK